MSLGATISPMRGGLLPVRRTPSLCEGVGASRLCVARSGYSDDALFGQGGNLGVISLLIRSIKKIPVLLVLLVSITFLVKSTLLENFFIPSSSMAPSLEENEHVVVSKVAYGLWLPGFAKQLVRWATPERGEVVVFTRDDDPKTIGDESERTMVKRVVAVGGDSVVIKGTTVSVNGVSLWEPYAHWSRGGSTEAQVFAVPYGTVFVLGDNRDESFDSRYWRDPFVEQSRIVGPVALVY